MESERDTAVQHHLCVRDGRFRWKHAEVVVTLGDDGIAYHLDGRSGLRRFRDLRTVRMQAMTTGHGAAWESVMELRFASGLPLLIYSNGPSGSDDPERDAAFVAFVEAFHRRIPDDLRGSIQFLRGVSAGRHQVMVAAVFLFGLICAGVAYILLGMARKPVSWWQILFVLGAMGTFGFWMLTTARKSTPGTYDSHNPPRDLYPE